MARHIGKAFIDAWLLTDWNFEHFNDKSKNHATIDAHGYDFISTLLLPFCADAACMYSYGVGSSLLVQTYRASSKASIGGTSNNEEFHAFIIHITEAKEDAFTPFGTGGVTSLIMAYKKYEKPNLEVYTVKNSDVIATSTGGSGEQPEGPSAPWRD